MKHLFFASSALAIATTAAPAALIITQYYEGASFDKYIELSNTSTAALDISDYTLSLWSNSNTEAWKTDGSSPTATVDLTTLFGSSTVAGGATIVVANPSHAKFTADFTDGVINFNGDDSMVLYSTPTYDTANILDAISFTDAGSEGANTSIVRVSTAAGYNTTSGSIFSDFAAWSNISQGTADSAPSGTDNAVGFSALAGVPEPSIALLGGLGILGLIRRRR